jgi:hypothetical protein
VSGCDSPLCFASLSLDLSPSVICVRERARERGRERGVSLCLSLCLYISLSLSLSLSLSHTHTHTHTHTHSHTSPCTRNTHTHTHTHTFTHAITRNRRNPRQRAHDGLNRAHPHVLENQKSQTSTHRCRIERHETQAGVATLADDVRQLVNSRRTKMFNIMFLPFLSFALTIILLSIIVAHCNARSKTVRHSENV